MSNNRPVNLYILMQRFWRENESGRLYIVRQGSKVSKVIVR